MFYCLTLDRTAQHRQQALASSSLAVMHLKTLQMQSDDPNNDILGIKLTYVQVNDKINLNGSVVVLSHNRLVCKTSKCIQLLHIPKLMFVIDGAHAS